MKDEFDFAGMTLREALDIAIRIEQEAMDRYTEFAEQMETHHTFEAATFFHFMAVNERKHRDSLRARREHLFGKASGKEAALQIVEAEAPPFQEAQAFMTLRHALDVAMRAEVHAHDFFAGALKHVKDPEVIRLFRELRDEEIEHQDLVQREIDKLPPGKDPDPTAHVDDPIGL